MIRLDSEAQASLQTLLIDYDFGMLTDTEFNDECCRILMDMMFRHGYTH